MQPDRFGTPHEFKDVQPKGPDISIFFSAHELPEDYRGMKEIFEKADTYIVEAHGWKPKDLELLRAISRGEHKPAHRRQGREPQNAIELEDEWLYGSGKRVEIIDVPFDHPLATEDDGTSDLLDVADELLYRGDVQVAINQLTESAKRNADYLARKDAFIEQQIRDLLEQSWTHCLEQ